MDESAFALWRRRLSQPSTPGMDASSPRAHWLPLCLMALCLAAQVVARYRFGFLPENTWQGLHILMGLSGCLLILTLFHGRAMLQRVSAKTWAHLGIGIIAFLLFWHLGRIDSYHRWWADSVNPSDAFAPVYGFIYFASASTLFRLIVPFVTVWLLFSTRPRDLGLSLKGAGWRESPTPLWPVYLLLFICVLPFVIYVADTAPFLAKYPLGRAMIHKGAIALEHLFVHECFYLLIFISGEAFWRGYLSFGLERDFGLYALPMMIVPYVTAHFGKPLSETLGAIVAGAILGWLALKHRSIWLGVALHFAVALTMDLLAIHYNGFTIKVP